MVLICKRGQTVATQERAQMAIKHEEGGSNNDISENEQQKSPTHRKQKLLKENKKMSKNQQY